jgi:C-terminal binding protein
MYPDTALEQEVLGPGVEVIHGGAPHTGTLDALPDEVCARVDGLLIFRHWLRPEHIARFPKLKVVVRMGVGYDRLDRAACAARGITVCNVPDYGTMEVADHAISLALALRRGIILHHDLQRADPPAPWRYVDHPLIRRAEVQGFGILGLGGSAPRSRCAPRPSASRSASSTRICRTASTARSASPAPAA